jgi:hypothetical protein
MPFESILKISVLTVGIYLEIAVGIFNYHKYQSFLPMDDDNQQHMTMYFPFLLGAIVEIAQHYGASLPEKTDYALGFVAFFVEGLLFSFHLNTKERANVYVHVLLLVGIYGCVFFTLLEACFNRVILFAYGRILFTGLQGAWLIMAAFITDSPIPGLTWNLKDMTHVKMFAVYFCWYLIITLLMCFILLTILKFLYFCELDIFRNMYNELVYLDAKDRNFTIDYVDTGSHATRIVKKTHHIASHSDEEKSNLSNLIKMS